MRLTPLLALSLAATVGACDDPSDPSSRAASVRILTAPTSLLSEDTLRLQAQAVDTSGRAVPDVPLVWSVSDSTLLRLVDGVRGIVVAGAARGPAFVTVRLPSGAADSVRVRVQPRPDVMVRASGDGQVGIMNRELRAPVEVILLAEDGKGVEGVPIAFTVPADGGETNPATAVTDSSGRAVARWVLGSEGTRSLEARAVTMEALTVAFTATALVPGTWTWVAGDSTTTVTPHYGTLGVGDSANTPGSRVLPSVAVGPDGTLWLFGGESGTALRNDLWRMRDGVWAWVAGSNQPNQPGTRGEKGVPSAGNNPPAAFGGVMWVDAAGTVWLFGGLMDRFIDRRTDMLWRYDAGMWTWMAGDSMPNMAPRYQTVGTAAPDNSPGARVPGAHWLDGQGRRWIYGQGLGHQGRNDLWRHDAQGWALIHGDTARGKWPVAGARGVSAAGYTPGVRDFASAWWMTESLWLLGGGGLNESAAQVGTLADVWRYNDGRWAWMGGSIVGGTPGTYGLRAVGAPSNWIGARAGAAVAVSGDTTFLFGGVGTDGAGRSGSLNDLWMFENGRWTWLAGLPEIPAGRSSAPGRWGERNVADPRNMPDGRSGATLWVDAAGAVWLYGGRNHADLWRFDRTILP